MGMNSLFLRSSLRFGSTYVNTAAPHPSIRVVSDLTPGVLYLNEELIGHDPIWCSLAEDGLRFSVPKTQFSKELVNQKASDILQKSVFHLKQLFEMKRLGNYIALGQADTNLITAILHHPEMYQRYKQQEQELFSEENTQKMLALLETQPKVDVNIQDDELLPDRKQCDISLTWQA